MSSCNLKIESSEGSGDARRAFERAVHATRSATFASRNRPPRQIDKRRRVLEDWGMASFYQADASIKICPTSTPKPLAS